MNKRDVTGWEWLDWNCGDDWAIPLPEFPVDGEIVVRRWYVPDETPIIPTGWIYELVGGEAIYEGNLPYYLNFYQLAQDASSQSAYPSA